MALTLASNAITFTDNTSLSSGIITSAQLSAGAVPTKLTSEIGSLGFRNKIINGGMEIDQRNNGNSVQVIPFVNNAFPVDRWLGDASGAAATFQRVATTAKYVSFAVRMTGSTGNTNTNLQQRIESSIARTLVGSPVTVSFYASSPSATTLRIAVQAPNAQDDWASATNLFTPRDITITSTMTRYEVKFPSVLPSQANNGVNVWFLAQTGLNAGQYIDISGVQLEEGSYATPFEQRPIGLELSLCQRYYEVVQFLPSGITYRPNGDSRGSYIPFRQIKRATPSLSPTQTNIQVFAFSHLGNGVNLNGSIDYGADTNSVRIQSMGNFTNIGNQAGGGEVFAWADNAIRVITASAEL